MMDVCVYKIKLIHNNNNWKTEITHTYVEYVGLNLIKSMFYE